MNEILLRLSDYVVDIEFRYTDEPGAGWTSYQRLPDTPTDSALERVEALNKTTTSGMEFRLVGTRIDSVKELLT